MKIYLALTKISEYNTLLSFLLISSKQRWVTKVELVQRMGTFIKNKIPLFYNILKKTYFFIKKKSLIIQNKFFKIRSLHTILDHCDAYEYISFDFFDTLVHRIISPPDVLKFRTAEYSSLKLKELGYDINAELFNKIRNRVEQKLRNQSYQQSKDRETDLISIIEDTLFQISRKKLTFLTQAIITYEIKNEINHLYLNKEVEKTMATLKKKGKRIIICSDMYLSAEQLKEIAAHFGIASYIDRFYVSSTEKITKGSGRLFQFVLNDLAIDSKKILHVGDNLFSDVFSSEKIGIRSLYYYNKAILKHYKKLNAWVTPKKYVQKSAHHALIKHYMLKKSTLFDDYQTISHFLAPVFSLFAYQSLLKMHTLGIKKIFFLAREGIMLEKIFSKVLNNVLLFQVLKKPFTFKILYISRLTSTCTIYNSQKFDTLIETCLYATNHLSILNFIHTFNLSLNDFSNESIQLITPYLHSIDRKTLIQLFNDTIFGIELDCLLKNNIYYLKRYLSEQGVFSNEKIGLVDLGWGGTIQKNIGYLLQDYPETELFGFYFGTNSLATHENSSCHQRSIFFPGYILTYQHNNYHANKLNGAIPFLESVCGYDKIGTTIAYKENQEGLLVPVFENKNNNQEKNPFNELFQERILKHLLNDTKKFSDLFNIAGLPFDVLKEYTTKKFLQFIYKPKLIDVKKLHQFQFNYNWSSQSIIPLITLIKFSDVVKPMTLFKKIKKSPWRYGSLVVAPIPFLLTLHNFGLYFLHFYACIKQKVVSNLFKKKYD